MAKLKKKILKITGISIALGILYAVYCDNIFMDVVDQWVDQKYDYIQKNNATENTTYSVEKMRKEIYNITRQPLENDYPQDDEFEPRDQESEFEPRDDEFEQPMRNQHHRFGPRN